MKTGISIPDRIFEDAEKFAHQLGFSRNELYTKAITAYIDNYKNEVTAILNEFYNSEDSSLDNSVLNAQTLSTGINDAAW
jgi:metal-responsive CopG/Arc/MetJ family transcriptional regulator